MKTILQSPGLCLALMSWWIMVFLTVAVFTYPITEHPRSYLPFLVALVGTISSATALHVINARFRFWQRMGHWGKYVILNGCYAFSVVTIAAVILTLDSYRAVAYFGSDPEGSFGMLFIPSVLVYAVAGGFVCGVISLRGFLRRFVRRGS